MCINKKTQLSSLKKDYAHKKWKVTLVSLSGNIEQNFYPMKDRTNVNQEMSSVVKSKPQWH